MTQYARPTISDAVYRDGEGRVIAYGERWGDDLPPEDAYSVTSNLDRFRPLHVVANSLIEYLVQTYDLEVEDDPAVASDLMRRREDIVRAVRLTPQLKAAPLTFVFTSFPSVIVHAGLAHDLLFPFCGCDACDEEWHAQADELEWQVLAVVGGRYVEHQVRGSYLIGSFELTAVDGSRSISGSGPGGEVGGISEVELEERRRPAQVHEKERRWLPWLTRPGV